MSEVEARQVRLRFSADEWVRVEAASALAGCGSLSEFATLAVRAAVEAGRKSVGSQPSEAA